MAKFQQKLISLEGGGLNIMDIFKVALDKTSFNIVNENSNYESKKFHRL